MAFNDNKKDQIWRKYHGTNIEGIDSFGTKINKSNCDYDHIYPESKGGKDYVENGIPMHSDNNKEKADNLNETINNHKFEVKESSSGIGTLYIDGNKVSKW